VVVPVVGSRAAARREGKEEVRVTVSNAPLQLPLTGGDSYADRLTCGNWAAP
jgi:hypothetical protein